MKKLNILSFLLLLITCLFTVATAYSNVTTNLIDNFEMPLAWRFSAYPKGIYQFNISSTNEVRSGQQALKLEFSVASFANFNFGTSYNTEKSIESILIPGTFVPGSENSVGVWVEGSESGPDNSEKLQFTFSDINNKSYTITAVNEDNGHTAFYRSDYGWHFWRVNPADTISSTSFPIRLMNLNINGWDRGESSRDRCLVLDDLTVISSQTSLPEFTLETIFPTVTSPENFDLNLRMGNFSGQTVTGSLKYAFYNKGNQIIPGDDFANEKPASSSSTNDQYHGPAGVVIDGKNAWDSQHYSTYSEQPEDGEWWKVDFGEIKTVGWLALKTAPHGATVDVYISESGTFWSPVLTNLVLSDWVTYTYLLAPQVSGRFMKVQFSRAPFTKNDDYYVGMVYFAATEGIKLPNGLYAPSWSDTVLNYGDTSFEIPKGVSIINPLKDLPQFPVCLGLGQLDVKISKNSETTELGDTFFFTCHKPLKPGLTNTFFGSNAGFFDNVGFVGDVGGRSERQWVNWSMFVETNGPIDLDNYTLSELYNYDRWPWYKNILRDSLSAGMENVGVINKTPDLFSTDPDLESDPGPAAYPSCDLARDDNGDGHIDYTNTHFYRFVYELAALYSDYITDWEICNEYNLFKGNTWDSWRGTIAGVGYDYSADPVTQYIINSSSMTLEQRGKDYMEQMRAGFMAIKAGNPEARATMMGLAGLDSWLIRKMMDYEYDDGKHGWEFTDGFNFHAYFADERPETSDFNGNTSGGRLSKPFVDILDEFLEWTYTNYPTYPTRLTEFGWDDRFGQWKPEGKSIPVSFDTQAAYMSRFFMIGLSRNLEKMHWFTAEDLWGSFFFAGMGLLDLSALPKKSSLAMSTTSAVIGDAKFLEFVETNDSNIWSMVFENGPNDRVQAVWAVSGSVDNVELDVSALLEHMNLVPTDFTATVEFLYGNYPTNIIVEDGKISLDISESPCFIIPEKNVPEPISLSCYSLVFLFTFIRFLI